MIIIPLENGQPTQPQPEGTIAILNNGEQLQCYLEGDDLPAALQPQQPIAEPQWDDFYKEQRDLIFQLLPNAANQLVAMALMVEFGKRPNLSISNLIDYWNASISPLLTPEAITSLNNSAQDHDLPVRIAQSGQMEPV